ncbi:MAG TPA: vitamin K epoxide reductase family protein [Dehalococcoidia bacterium]|nr:vitamin K epoxide reductase family protein [Dehalococcoidia bacterium]
MNGTRLWLLLALLGLAGLGTSGYLTYSHYADQVTVCAGIGSCEFVQTSQYSDVAGVPVALLGLLFFVGLEGVVALRLLGLPQALQWGAPAVFAMTLGGLAFVSYLTYVELFVIKAICIWCVATAAITLACFVVAASGSWPLALREEEALA